MNTLNRHKLLVGTGFLILLGGVTYSCKDFLNALPQGTLNEATLANAAGVEGSLIAAYRALDCTNSTNTDWGCAASDWAFGSVPSDEAYKGSEASDQPGVTDLELYNWTTGSADDYLNTKWTAVYEGVFRSNATLRLLHLVQAEKPTEIDTATAHRIEGEAKFLRAHRSEEHTSELQSRLHLVCRLLLEKKKKKHRNAETERADNKEQDR